MRTAKNIINNSTPPPQITEKRNSFGNITHFIVMLIMFSAIQIFPQQDPELISDRQMMMGVEGVDSTTIVIHSIEAMSNNVWVYNWSQYVVDPDPAILNSIIATIGPVPSSNELPGFDFIWKLDEPEEESPWGLGFYKVTNSLNSDYFFIDARHIHTANPDFFVLIDQNYNNEYYKINRGSISSNLIASISNGEIIRYWDILDELPNTGGLTTYWSRALVKLNSQNGHPRLVWGPNQMFYTTSYQIYRAVVPINTTPSNYQLIQTVNSNTFEYIDVSQDVGSSAEEAHYYIRAVGPNNWANTNTIKYGISEPWAVKNKPENANLESEIYQLSQNYPNPFNPSTQIKYSIAEKSNVVIKVYNMMGQEVISLVNETKEAGNYSV